MKILKFSEFLNESKLNELSNSTIVEIEDLVIRMIDLFGVDNRGRDFLISKGIDVNADSYAIIDDVFDKHINVQDLRDVFESLNANESKQGGWSKLMSDVRKNSESGPWTVVCLNNRKVVDQKTVKDIQLIPAVFEELCDKNPNCFISIEDSTGNQVFTKKIK